MASRWALGGRTKLLETGIPEGRPLRFRSVAYALLGLGVIGVGIYSLVGAFDSTQNDGWLAEWAGASFFWFLLFMMGWCYVGRSWMDVGREGLSVRNPFRVAQIPWSALTGADANGLALKLRTTAWSINVFAIEPSNWEQMRSKPSRAARVATALMAEAAEHDGEAGGDPVRRWSLPWRPAIFAVVVAVAMLYPFYTQRAHL